MAVPERDTVYNTETNRVVTRESNATGWFVGIIVALALLAIGYLVFSANSGPSTTTTNLDVNNTPAVTAPADTAPVAPSTDTSTTPSMSAPADTAAPAATDTAPATGTTAPAAGTGADAAAPATTEPAPAQ